MDHSNENFIDPSSVSPMSTALRYGVIWALIGILIGLLSHVMGWNNPATPNIAMSMVIWVAMIAVSVVMTMMAIKHHRDQELGGNITLGRAFYVGFLTALISAVIGVVWMAIYVNLIAPDMFGNMEEMMVEQWEEAGMSDEEIEQAKGFAGAFTGPTMMIFSPFIVRIIWGALLSLIMGAIMKKDPVHHA